MCLKRIAEPDTRCGELLEARIAKVCDYGERVWMGVGDV